MRLGTRRRSGNERVKTEKQMFKGCQIFIKIFALVELLSIVKLNSKSQMKYPKILRIVLSVCQLPD